MEDIQQYNFTVKSNIHDYEVHFIDDVKRTLENELKEGDFIIIDNKVKALYPEWFEEVLTISSTSGLMQLNLRKVTKK